MRPHRGQVRPAAAPVVTLQVKRPGAPGFADVGQVRLSADGSFLRRITLTPAAAYRYRWTDSAQTPRLSGVVDLSRREKTELRAAAAV